MDDVLSFVVENCRFNMKAVSRINDYIITGSETLF